MALWSWVCVYYESFVLHSSTSPSTAAGRRGWWRHRRRTTTRPGTRSRWSATEATASSPWTRTASGRLASPATRPASCLRRTTTAASAISARVFAIILWHVYYYVQTVHSKFNKMTLDQFSKCYIRGNDDTACVVVDQRPYVRNVETRVWKISLTNPFKGEQVWI